MQLVFLFHRDLLAGEVGHLLVGISGIFLIVTVGLGVKMAWPQRNQWRAALKPIRWVGSPVRPLYSWHKAFGLWIAVPLLVSAMTGVGIVWSASVQKLLAVTYPSPPAAPPGAIANRITPDAALAVARRQLPDARFSLIDLPAKGVPWYRVRPRQAGESRQTFGMTTIHVDARTGKVLAFHDPRQATAGQALIGAFYPLHTGEMFGTLSHIIQLLTGIGFAAVGAFGAALWGAKRLRKHGRLIPLWFPLRRVQS